MANSETMKERMVRMEERTSNIQKNVKNIDAKQDVILEKLDNLPNVFVTRREVSLIKWVIGVGFSLVGVYLAVTR